MGLLARCKGHPLLLTFVLLKKGVSTGKKRSLWLLWELSLCMFLYGVPVSQNGYSQHLCERSPFAQFPLARRLKKTPRFPKGKALWHCPLFLVNIWFMFCQWQEAVLTVHPSPATAPVMVCFPHCLAFHQLPQREPPRHPRPPTLVQKCRPLKHEAEGQQAVEWDLRCVRQSDASVQGNQTSGGRLGTQELALCLEQGAPQARAKLRLHRRLPISSSLHL